MNGWFQYHVSFSGVMPSSGWLASIRRRFTPLGDSVEESGSESSKIFQEKSLNSTYNRLIEPEISQHPPTRHSQFTTKHFTTEHISGKEDINFGVFEGNFGDNATYTYEEIKSIASHLSTSSTFKSNGALSLPSSNSSANSIAVDKKKWRKGAVETSPSQLFAPEKMMPSSKKSSLKSSDSLHGNNSSIAKCSKETGSSPGLKTKGDDKDFLTKPAVYVPPGVVEVTGQDGKTSAAEVSYSTGRYGFLYAITISQLAIRSC